MPLSTDALNKESLALREALAEQGRRVRKLVAASLDAFFTADAEKARVVLELDDEIDREDVEVEKRAVVLLTKVANEATPCDDRPLRGLLTLVKVNNEYERIADAGVEIAQRTLQLSGSPASFPPTARVMTNSVLGILRDVTKAYDRQDPTLARLVIQSEHMVITFKSEILRAAERAVASGEITVDLAFDLHELAGQCVLMVDHATNIAEQVIYESTGVIVRHRAGEWVEQAARDEVARDHAARNGSDDD
jgi:phosphate transport system protein